MSWNRDEDEDEMRELRQSARHAALPKREKPPPRQLPIHDEDGPPKPKITQTLKSDPTAAYEEGMILTLEEEEQLKKFQLPTSFGMQNKKPSQREMIEKTRREPVEAPKKPVVGPVRSKIGPSRPSSDNNNNLDDIQVGPPRPANVGPSKPANIGPPKPANRNDEDDFIGPPRPTNLQVPEEEEEEEQLEVMEDQTNFYKIPYSYEAKLKGHTKMISGLTLDPAGGRLITGGFDAQVMFWDFAGMDASMKSFRQIEPIEGSNIRTVQFSNSGDRFLVAPANSQARLYDRDGFELGECVKGDMYITDMTNTRGHVATIGNATWKPKEKNIFMTCSVDGTVRIWDANDLEKQKSLAKAKSTGGRRIGLTYCAFSADGSNFCAGAQDGTIQVWGSNGPFNRPSTIIPNAHQPGSDISCLTYSVDGYTIISRATDATMKVWDVRNPRTSLADFEDLPSAEETRCIFSPDDRLMITGTHTVRGKGTGLLVFFDKTLLKRVKQIGIAQDTGVSSVLWHEKINQIVVGTTSGAAHVLYDPALSFHGALLCVTRTPREVDPSDYEPPRPVQLPNGIPMYTDMANQKRKDARAKFDPRKSAKIDPKQTSAQPRIRGSLSQTLLRSVINYDPTREEDPRQAFLKHAEEAEKNPVWFAAYKKTQPEPIFDYSEEPEEGVVKPTTDEI